MINKTQTHQERSAEVSRLLSEGPNYPISEIIPDPTEGQRVDDPDKAQAMAIPFHQNRESARRSFEGLLISDQIGRGAIFLSKRDRKHPSFRDNMGDEFSERTFSLLTRGAKNWRDLKKTVYKSELLNRVHDAKGSARIHANRALEMAELTQKWAGILYDNPISEEYREEHAQDFVFWGERSGDAKTSDVKTLSRIEIQAKAMRSSIDNLKTQSQKEYTLADALRESKQGHDSTIERLLRNMRQVRIDKEEDNPDASRDEWNKLLTNPNTTSQQLAAFRKDLFEKAEIQPEEKKLIEMITVLEDVASGRASNKGRIPAKI